MAIVLGQPAPPDLDGVLSALREWQYDDTPLQLHPGDVGWHWRFGADATAAALRTWTRDGDLVAVGMLDSPALVRLAVAPDLHRDHAVAEQLVADLTRPEAGVLGPGTVYVAAPPRALVEDLLDEEGWATDEPWTPLQRDLSTPVEGCPLRLEVVGPQLVHERVAVQRAAFDNSTFTEERWRAMAAGPAYSDARCLLGYDREGQAVAAVTVWSAGPGRPGLLEPLGVHRDHQGHGYGTAIGVAAAAVLQEIGSSSAIVATPTANAAALSTYVAAGFTALPEVRDRRRPM
ncbi:MAG TPA: GNAT family N-acetyltransferase [Nocardioidaceae bacterium]|nr:GNAT family N-acetyltransferase [Nocardioidaceae bacterium]